MRLGFLLLCCFFSFNLFAQETPYKVNFTTEKIKIDGVMDEQTWQNAPIMTDFFQFFPSDAKAQYQTEVKLAYDDKYIYVLSKCYVKGKNFVIPSFRRDYRAGGNDNISYVFDTFSDKTNAFLFGLNPLGVMREALFFNGGVDNSSFSDFWDNKWVGTSKVYDDNYWISEAAIPFTTLRFKEGTTKWNFKCYRFDTQANENSASVKMPQNLIVMNLGYANPIEFEKPLRKSGPNISIIPYLAAGSSQDFTNAKNPNNGNRFNFGADAKVAVTSGLNLDLTYNPDFSNVEADRQIVNLTRFDINLPEQRQFFLENSDLFSGFGSFISNPFLPPQGNLGGAGNQIISPFFSRQIGIAKDTVTNVGVQNRIVYGARLSGKINNNWRVGLLNTQTADDEFKGISAANFTVGSLQRKVFGRSNISAIFVNKQTLHSEVGKGLSNYNRVGGVEYNLASKDARWNGKIFYHQAFTEDKKKDAFAHGVSLTYSVQKYTFKWQHDWVGKGYDAEVGFVPRKDFFHINPTVGWSFYPRTKIVNRYSVGMAFDQYSMPSVGVTDRIAGPFISMALQNSVRFLLSVNQNYTYLFADFDALRSNNKLPLLKKGNSYTYYSATLNYTSDQRKKLWFFTTPIIGQYYNGSIVSLSGALNYRYQPYMALAVNVTYNNIHLPVGSNKVYLIVPRFDWTFSKSVFLTAFMQYNSQFDNMNINTRFQWRFAPVSDFFLVYTDNYNTTNWQSRSRSIQAKVTYWLSI